MQSLILFILLIELPIALGDSTKPIPPMGELIESLVLELITSIFLLKHYSNNISLCNSLCFCRHSTSVLHLSAYKVVISLVEKLAFVLVLNMLIVKGKRAQSDHCFCNVKGYLPCGLGIHSEKTDSSHLHCLLFIRS